MKVLFLTNVPSPYRVDFFNEFGKYCDLTVVFERKSSSERDESWKNFSFKTFKGCFLKGIPFGSSASISLGVIKFIKDKKFDLIICSNFSTPTGLIAVSYMQRHKIAYYIETDGGTPKSGKGFKESLKTKAIKNAEGYFSTSDANDDYFLAYGAKKDKIYRYPFTSLFDADIYRETAREEEKVSLREKLNIKEKIVVISVGRFSYLNGYGKGYDVLLKAAADLSKEIGWYVIGGKPTEEFERLLKNSGLSNFHFVDFKLKDQLKEYYRASDLFVLMTVGEAWGLVVNEAMACGLPVITTDKCVAGVELIKEGKNGYVIPVGDHAALAKLISENVFDPVRLREMGENAIKTIKDYSFENMALAHDRIIKKILSENAK